jgi:hypothetical protein
MADWSEHLTAELLPAVFASSHVPLNGRGREPVPANDQPAVSSVLGPETSVRLVDLNVAVLTVDARLALLYAEFSGVFQPTAPGLPPDRGMQHLIPLLPALKPRSEHRFTFPA